MAERLTKADLKLLTALQVEDQAALPTGRSAQTLRALGYADWNDRAGPRTWWLTITEAGRAALNEARDAE